MSEKITALEIELALAGYFDSGRNFVIPNVSHGFRGINYEIDIMVVTRSMYAYEVEIKVSAGDLRRDRNKHKWKYCKDQHFFRRSYFAMPEDMIKYHDLVPEHSGILNVSYNERSFWFTVQEARPPVVDKLARKITDAEYKHLGDLAMLRMWELKRNIRRHISQNR